MYAGPGRGWMAMAMAVAEVAVDVYVCECVDSSEVVCREAI
jgi:hypothetical protein